MIFLPISDLCQRHHLVQLRLHIRHRHLVQRHPQLHTRRSQPHQPPWLLPLHHKDLAWYVRIPAIELKVFQCEFTDVLCAFSLLSDGTNGRNCWRCCYWIGSRKFCHHCQIHSNEIFLIFSPNFLSFSVGTHHWPCNDWHVLRRF